MTSQAEPNPNDAVRLRQAAIGAVIFMIGNVIWNFLIPFPVVGFVITYLSIRTDLKAKNPNSNPKYERKARMFLAISVVGVVLCGELGQAINTGVQAGRLSDVWSIWWTRLTSQANWRGQWFLLTLAAVLIVVELVQIAKSIREEGQSGGSHGAEEQDQLRWHAGYGDPSAAGAGVLSDRAGDNVLTADQLPQYVSRDPQSADPPGFGVVPTSFVMPAALSPARQEAAPDPDQFNYGGSISAQVDPGQPALMNEYGMVQPPSSGHMFDPTGRSDFVKWEAQPGVNEAARSDVQETSTATKSALVNLNMANQTQLESLPGIGRVTAKAILEWRELHGGFTRLEQLKQVSGIGDKTYELVLPHVTI